jgi:hypothetical protein
MLQRTLPAGFIAPCLPTKTDTPPSGSDWLYEIKLTASDGKAIFNYFHESSVDLA